MSAARPRPSNDDAFALTTATVNNFGPCTCMRAGSYVVVCGGHEFLHDDPTQRGLAVQWQRLLWMRTQRPALIAQECLAERPFAPTRVDDPDKLPW